MVSRYQDLQIYQLSVDLSVEIYKIVKSFPKEETYGMSDQLRRAVTSIGANIAEGFGRYHFRDKLVFFYNARGSTYEVMHFLEVASRIGYITENDKIEMFKKLNDLSVKLNNFISSIGKTTNDHE